MAKGALLIGCDFLPTQEHVEYALKQGYIKNFERVNTFKYKLHTDKNLAIQFYLNIQFQEGWDSPGGIEVMELTLNDGRKMWAVYPGVGETSEHTKIDNTEKNEVGQNESDGNMALEIGTCSHCGITVKPTADGLCPSCRNPFVRVPEQLQVSLENKDLIEEPLYDEIKKTEKQEESGGKLSKESIGYGRGWIYGAIPIFGIFSAIVCLFAKKYRLAFQSMVISLANVLALLMLIFSTVSLGESNHGVNLGNYVGLFWLIELFLPFLTTYVVSKMDWPE